MPRCPPTSRRVADDVLALHGLEAAAAGRGRPAAGAVPPTTSGGRSRRLDLVALGEDHRALDGVQELAHVAGPGVRLERREGAGAQPLDAVGGVGLHEVPGQQRHVLAALAQGRQLDGDRVDAVVEVLAELTRASSPRRDRGWSPPPGARRRAAAGSRRRGRTCPLSSTRRSFTWLSGSISPISSRKSVPPSASSMRPGLVPTAPVKAPFSWPNSSDSSTSRGRAPQWMGTNGRVGALRALVDRARHQLLAGAALAEDQHGGVRRRHALHHAQHLLHARAPGEDAAEGLGARAAARAGPRCRAGAGPSPPPCG